MWVFMSEIVKFPLDRVRSPERALNEIDDSVPLLDLKSEYSLNIKAREAFIVGACVGAVAVWAYNKLTP